MKWDFQKVLSRKLQGIFKSPRSSLCYFLFLIQKYQKPYQNFISFSKEVR